MIMQAKNNFLAIGVSLLTTLSLINVAAAHPRHHDAKPVVAFAYPALSDEEGSKFEKLQTALSAKPDDPGAAVAFARYAASLARRDGNTDLLKLAAGSLAPWSAVDEPPIDILIVRANVKQIDHRFDEALADLDQIIVRDPYNPQALLSRAFVLTTTGRAREAAADCARIRPNVSVTIRETCAARALSLSGAAQRSLTRLEASVRALKAKSKTEKTFAISVAAEIAERIGETEKATGFYAELLEADPRSVFVRAAYADFLVSQNKFAEARAIIGDRPHTETLMLLRVLASAGPSDQPANAAAAELKARMENDLAKDDYSHAREYARFALNRMNDPHFAFDMARANWRVQKEPLDARILLAAAEAAGDHETTHEIEAWIEATGIEDKGLQAALAAEAEPV